MSRLFSSSEDNVERSKEEPTSSTISLLHEGGQQNAKMKLFVPLLVLVACLFKLTISQKIMSSLPKAQPKHNTVPRLPVVKKQRKRRIVVAKAKSGIRFKPSFKNKQSAPKLVYVAYNIVSGAIVIFSDLYHTFEKNSVDQQLLDINIPERIEGYFSIPLHCKGLFVLPVPTANDSSMLVLCNPATKEVITLPGSNNKHAPRSELKENEGMILRAGFGFVPSTQAYKVARFFYRSYDVGKRSYSMGFEVFTVGGVSSSWRLVPEDPPHPIRSICPMFAGTTSVYFYVWQLLDPSSPNAFLRFDLRNEKFSTLYPPYSLRHFSVESMILANLQGSLCLSVLSGNNTKLSVFTSRRGNSHDWTPRFCFSVLVQPGSAFVTPILEYRGKLLARVNDLHSQRLEWYDLKDGSLHEVDGQISEDLKAEKAGFTLFLHRPWFHVSSYEKCLFKLGS